MIRIFVNIYFPLKRTNFKVQTEKYIYEYMKSESQTYQSLIPKNRVNDFQLKLCVQL